MNEVQLYRALNSVGKACFVKYFHYSSDESLSIHELVDLLMQEENYAEKATYMRVAHSRRIIKAGRAKDALHLVVRSRVPENIKTKARKLLGDLPSNVIASELKPQDTNEVVCKTQEPLTKKTLQGDEESRQITEKIVKTLGTDKIVEFRSYMINTGLASASNAIQVEDTIPLIYKYVSLERLFTCLPEVGDGTLRATQPAALNDPFECAVRPVFVEQSEEEGNMSLSRVLTDLHPATPVNEADVAKARIEYGSLFLRELLSRQLSKRIGIVSFATRPRQLLMWSHYTLNCSGFVIGYDVTQLIRLTKREGGLRPVRYGAELPPIADYAVMDESNLNGLLSYKNSQWEYEQEWRLIVDLKDTIGTGKIDRQGQSINLIRIPNEAVCRVYYTERTPSDAVNKVMERLSDPNNRFNTRKPVKLVQSIEKYKYDVATSEPFTTILSINLGTEWGEPTGKGLK